MTPAELLAARHTLGLSQARLAAALGLSRVYVGQMERGAYGIEPRTALAVQYLLLTRTTPRKARALSYCDDALHNPNPPARKLRPISR